MDPGGVGIHSLPAAGYRLWQLLEGIEAGLTFKVLFWLFLLVALVIVYQLAYRQIGRINAFDKKASIRKYPGRDPKTAPFVKKRIVTLSKHAIGVWSDIFSGVALLILMGLVAPAILLGIVIINAEWLFGPDQCALVSAKNLECVSASPSDMYGFLLDQSFKGAGNDIAEVFGLNLSHVQNAEKSYVFSGLVLAFRATSGAAALSILYFLGQFMLSLWGLVHELGKRVIQLCMLWWHSIWRSALARFGVHIKETPPQTPEPEK